MSREDASSGGVADNVTTGRVEGEKKEEQVIEVAEWSLDMPQEKYCQNDVRQELEEVYGLKERSHQNIDQAWESLSRLPRFGRTSARHVWGSAYQKKPYSLQLEITDEQWKSMSKMGANLLGKNALSGRFISPRKKGVRAAIWDGRRETGIESDKDDEHH